MEKSINKLYKYALIYNNKCKKDFQIQRINA